MYEIAMAEQQQQQGVRSEDGDGVSSLTAELLSRSTELAALVDRLPDLHLAVAGSTDARAVDGCQEGDYSCASSSLEQVCLLLECVTQALRSRLQPAVNEASQQLSPQQQQQQQQQQSGCRVATVAAAAADRDVASKRGRQVSPRRSNRCKKLAPARCSMRRSSNSSSNSRSSGGGGGCGHAVVASSSCAVSDRGVPIQLQHDNTTLRDGASGDRGDGCGERCPLPASSSSSSFSSSARTVSLAVGSSGNAEQPQQEQRLSVSTALATPGASSDGCGDPEPTVAEHQLQLLPEAQASRVAIDGRGADDAVDTAEPHAQRRSQPGQQLCNSPQSYPPKSGIGVECPTCGKSLRASALPIHTRLAHGKDVERRRRASIGGRGAAARLTSTSQARAANRRAGRQAAGRELSADESSACAPSADDDAVSEEAEEEHDRDVEDDAEDEDDCELSLLSGDSARGPAAARCHLVYACALCVVVQPPQPSSIEPAAQPDCTTPSDCHSHDGRPMPVVVRSRTFVASRYDRLLQHVRSRHLTASGFASTDDGVASDGCSGTTAATSLTAGSSNSSGRRAAHRRRRDLLACPECGRHLKLGGAVKDGYQRMLHHLWTKHGRQLPDYFEYALCDRCDYRAYSSKLLKDHQAYSHGSDACGGSSVADGGRRGQRAVCPECGKRVVRTYLKRHVQLMHAIHQATDGTGTTGCEQLTCQQCGKCIAGAQNLARHVRRVHARQRDYLCHLCSQQFFERKELHAHLFARHGVNASGRAELACDEPGCAFRAIHREVLAKHRLAAHVTAREHACSRCGKAFKTRAVLRQHELLVHGRPAPEGDQQLRTRGDGSAATPAIDGCRDAVTVADTATATVVSDVTALAADSAAKRHSCQHCSFSSHARQYLQRHIKIHSVEKRYRCDACQYKSHFLENVKKHKRNVHDKRASSTAATAAMATHQRSDDALTADPMQLPAARSHITPAAAAMIPTGVLDAFVLPASYECQQAMQQQTLRQCLDFTDGTGVVSAQHVFNGTTAEVRAADGFGQLQQLPPIAVAQHAGLVGSASSLVLTCDSDRTAAVPLLTANLGSMNGTGLRLPDVYDGVAEVVACDNDSTCSPVALSCLSGRLMPPVVTLAELHQPLADCVSAAAADDAAAAAVTVGMSTTLESIVPLSVLPALVASRAVPSPVLVSGAAEPSSAEEGPMYPGTPLASIAQMPLLQMPFSPELHM